MPLGERVIQKLENLIDTELQSKPLYANKIRLPLLTSADLWHKSGRYFGAGDELMRLFDRKGKEFVLGPTHEETITHLVASLGARNSKDLPLNLYQTTSKYRDELRPRFGLLRGREFLMKDMYSFHETIACAHTTYSQVCGAYENILTALGLPFFKVDADAGNMGGTLTHEYQVLADIGEDDVVHCPSCGHSSNLELLPEHSQPDPICNREDIETGQPCIGSLQLRKGIEVAQAFLLGSKYSQVFNAKGGVPLVDLQMGCYGIGVSRLLAACVEVDSGHDAHGIIWPKIIAPYQAVVISAPGNAIARALYSGNAEEFSGLLGQSYQSGCEVLLDDRTKDSFGVKLLEANLIGVPYIVVVGKTYEEGLVELIIRKTGISQILPKEEAIRQIIGL